MSSSQSSSSRPVYIPPNKRNKRQRFHGAFQGGFSAGYFNTVDTKEGWKPSNTKISKGQSQRLEDFMDEQDHEEWGGPKSIRQDYNNNAISGSKNTAAAATENHLGSNNNDNYNDDNNQDNIGSQTRPPSSSVPLHDIGNASASSSLFQVTHQTVGPRLLRYLGWREGHHDNKGTHTAFVPVADGEHDDNDNNNNNHDENNKEDGGTQIILSKKKLRQIKLQSTKINKLPPPKLDLCGLGFEAHENAPEFRQHKLRRQKLAQQRAEGSTVSNNVYRTSRLLSSKNHPNIDDDNNNNNNNTNLQGNNDYLNYETTEDFVGTKSVSGFALRDDDDDAYDDDNNNNHNRNQLLANITRSDEYNTEVYEHQDSDDDRNDEHRENDYNNNTTAIKPSSSSKVSHSSSRLETDFGGALASWAGTAATKSTAAVTSKSSMFTSDGRPPIHGFALGGSLESHKKRYPGPDIPRDYTLQKHKFKENEHPRIFQTLAHAVQIQHQQLPPTTKAVHTFHTNAISRPPPVPRAMMMNTQQFAGLAAAMKNRFTSSTTNTNDDEPGSTAGLQQQQQKSGIYQPKSGESSKRGIPTVELPPLPPPPATSTSTAAGASVKNITISRTVHTFVPHPLVCKRFGVPVPKHISAAGTSTIRNDDKSSSDHKSSKEAKFFENEILPIRDKAAAAAAAAQKTKKKEGDKESSSNTNNLALQHQQDENVDGDHGELPLMSAVERPPMDKLHSIFEPDSAEESSEPDTDLDSLNDDEMGDDDNRDKAKSKPTTTQAADKSSVHVANPTTTSSALVIIDASNKESQLEKKNPSEHDHNDDDDSSSQNSTDHSLRKRHKRKRRKHGRHDSHSSSRKVEKKKKKRKHHKHRHRNQHHRVRKDDDFDDEDEDGRSISADGSMSDSSPYDKEDQRGRRRRKRSRSPSSVRDGESSSSSRSSDDRRARKERQRRRKKHKGRRKKSDRR